MKNIKGILLAAGESSRMGFPKALLELGGRTVIENLLDEYTNSVLSDVVLVLGCHREKILPFVKKFPDVSVAVNEHYENEMLSSIQVGLSTLENCDGVLIGLVDHPFIDRQIIDLLAEKFDGKSIVIPVYEERKGHPIIVPFSLKGEIMSLDPKTHSLRDVINAHRKSVTLVNVGTDRILFDMDTKSDYERAKKLWKK